MAGGCPLGRPVADLEFVAVGELVGCIEGVQRLGRSVVEARRGCGMIAHRLDVVPDDPRRVTADDGENRVAPAGEQVADRGCDRR